jgi:hypothetical protein
MDNPFPRGLQAAMVGETPFGCLPSVQCFGLWDETQCIITTENNAVSITNTTIAIGESK